MEEVKTKLVSYEVSLKWDDESGTGTAHSENRMPLLFSAPAEFGGPKTTWTPEHLLCASLASCYTTTFLHFAKKMKVQVTGFSVSATVEFEKGNTGMVASRFILHPAFQLHNNPGQHVLDNLMMIAKKYCFVGNSVKGEVVVDQKILNN
jgi:organic hydroperoxide reductase OsmC/OhrA